MSRKKSLKRKEKTKVSQIELLNDALKEAEKKETAPAAGATPPAALPAPETKVQKLAKAFFHEFMGKAMNITKSFSNEHLTVIVYTFGEMFDDTGPLAPADVVCYEITSMSNPDIVLFLDEDSISVSFKGKPLTISEDEAAFIFANAIGYIKKYGIENAA